MSNPFANLTAPAPLLATNRPNRRESPPPPYIINQPTPPLLKEWAPNRAPTSTDSDRTITSASDDSHRSTLKRIAKETLTAIREGGYSYQGIGQDLAEAIKDAKSKTVYYSPSSYIKRWASSTQPNPTHSSPTHISILHITALDAARRLNNIYMGNPFDSGKIGILNFASPRKPGGNFKNGSESQETSIARSSTLHSSLKADEAQHFYKRYTHENAYYLYSHGMVYSPNICIFRDDEGNWTYPFLVDVLSCAAVNVGKVHRTNGGITSSQEIEIEKEMSERMGRILYLFECKGVRNIILGAFGTGVFRNSVTSVARIWAHLLLLPEARFKDSFDRVIFAITGEETFADFQKTFNAWNRQSRTPSVWLEAAYGPGSDA